MGECVQGVGSVRCLLPMGEQGYNDIVGELMLSMEPRFRRCRKSS